MPAASRLCTTPPAACAAPARSTPACLLRPAAAPGGLTFTAAIPAAHSLLLFLHLRTYPLCRHTGTRARTLPTAPLPRAYAPAFYALYLYLPLPAAAAAAFYTATTHLPPAFAYLPTSAACRAPPPLLPPSPTRAALPPHHSNTTTSRAFRCRRCTFPASFRHAFLNGGGHSAAHLTTARLSTAIQCLRCLLYIWTDVVYLILCAFAPRPRGTARAHLRLPLSLPAAIPPATRTPAHRYCLRRGTAYHAQRTPALTTGSSLPRMRTTCPCAAAAHCI